MLQTDSNLLTNKLITLVCCYNNLEQYNTLLSSLKNQSIEFDIVGIDNTQGRFPSCSIALNYGISQVKTSYVLFLHQDIVLLEAKTLENYVKYLKQIKVNDILGVVGISSDSNIVQTNIYFDRIHRFQNTKRVIGLQVCETLDECFFGGYSQYFKRNPFNERLCNNWHLYAVEKCLSTRREKNNVYVCDIELIHHSKGKINSNFNSNFYWICKEYHHFTPYISSPCLCSKTNLRGRLYTYIRSQLKVILHKY